MKQKHKIIGITLGDPGGIGPEVTLKALKKLALKKVSIVLFGSKSTLTHPLLSKYLPLENIEPYPKNSSLIPQKIYLVDTKEQTFYVGKECKENAQIAINSILNAHTYIKEKKINAMVTAPICKSAFNLIGKAATGHTPFLQELSQAKKVSMAFYSKKLKILLATIHIPFKKVPEALTSDCLQTAFENAAIFCKKLGIKNPKIAVAGLNPHASEGGLFGAEEKEISKEIQKFNSKDVTLTGPYPPDTLYYHAAKKEFECVVSLYHDQGLIPLKLIAFDEAVNVTIGLPFIRTSPDHGTAFDIAYQDKARETSMAEAIKLAIKLTS